MNLYTYTPSPEGAAATFEAAAAAAKSTHKCGEVRAVGPLVDVVVEDVVRRRTAALRVFGSALVTCVEIKFWAPHAIDATLSP